MQTPSTLSIWLAEQVIPLLLIAALVGVVILILQVSARMRKARMNVDRAGVSEDSFVQSLRIYGFDATIARTTFRYLQQTQGVSFPLKPSDLLDEDLGLDAFDIDQSVRDLLVLNERLYQPGLQHTPLVTVEDLVRLIQASPASRSWPPDLRPLPYCCCAICCCRVRGGGASGRA